MMLQFKSIKKGGFLTTWHPEHANIFQVLTSPFTAGHYGESYELLDDDSSSSVEDEEGGQLVIDDTFNQYKKKSKKSKKSKKKKDKEKDRRHSSKCMAKCTTPNAVIIYILMEKMRCLRCVHCFLSAP